MSANDIIALNAIIEEANKTRAPDLEANDFFELFAAEQVLKDFDLTDEDISNGQVGGGDDGGLDLSLIHI